MTPEIYPIDVIVNLIYEYSNHRYRYHRKINRTLALLQ